MTKLTLQPAPRFPFKVAIPVPGQDSALVEFTFKHRTKTALQDFVDNRPGTDELDTFLAMVEGWDLDAEFNRANAAELLENYIGAAACVYLAYLQESVKVKQGN